MREKRRWAVFLAGLVLLAGCGQSGAAAQDTAGAEETTVEKNSSEQSGQTAGADAESEAETAALARFTRRVRPALTVSYHALGREIYYEFSQTGAALSRDEAIARAAGKFLGYRVVSGDLGSAGGYKDWCVDKLGITALTVEIVGEDHRHPLTEKDLDGEEKNVWLPLLLAELVAEADGG